MQVLYFCGQAIDLLQGFFEFGLGAGQRCFEVLDAGLDLGAVAALVLSQSGGVLVA